MKSVKCVVVGDQGVGKSSLLAVQRRAIGLDNASSSLPIVLPEFSTTICTSASRKKTVSFCDTDANEDEEIRKFNYWGANVVLVLFSVHSRRSFRNVQCKWVPEIYNHVPSDIPVVVVGLHRSDTSKQVKVSEEEGKALVEELCCASYVSVSSLESLDAYEVFSIAAKLAKSNSYMSNENECALL